jgi:hypothetical protein
MLRSLGGVAGSRAGAGMLGGGREGEGGEGWI